MNVRDAAYRLVHDYPGGAAALGPRLGKRGTSLSAEVCPTPQAFAKFGLHDAQLAMALSGDHRLLYAQAAELGYLCLPLPAMPEGEADDEAELAARRVADVAQEFGDVMREASKALADRNVTDTERAAIERQWGELVARGQQMLSLFAALNTRLHDRQGGAA